MAAMQDIIHKNLETIAFLLICFSFIVRIYKPIVYTVLNKIYNLQQQISKSQKM